MQYSFSHFGTWTRRSVAVCGILSLSLLAQCNFGPPPVEEQKAAQEPKKSLVEQYAEESKKTAADPGLAATPAKVKDESKEKSGEN